MTEEPVCRLIMKLGLPTTISMLITNVYNMVDTWFVSRLGTKCDRSSWYCVWPDGNYSGIRFLCLDRVRERISAGLWGHIKRSGHVHFRQQAFTWRCFFGTAVSVFGILNLDGLWVTGKYRTILPYARIYVFYVLLSAPAMATGCVMNNILRYEGYASLAMIGLVSGGVLNNLETHFSCLDFTWEFVVFALSTMISQYISFGILLYFCCAVRHKAVCPFGIFTKKAKCLWKYSCVRFSKYGASGTLQVFLRWY